MRLAKANKEN